MAAEDVGVIIGRIAFMLLAGYIGYKVSKNVLTKRHQKKLIEKKSEEEINAII